jgi:acetyltransferase-like isoleucine patch superfamily enzyme
MIFKKLGFVYRYIIVRLLHLHGLKAGGFFFMEKDVTFLIEKGGNIYIEKGVYLKKGTVLECAENGSIHIGEKSVMGFYSWLGSRNFVKLGQKCLVGSYATIFDVNHEISTNDTIYDQGYKKGKTLIGDDCMIATKATVGGNVIIGSGCIVSANSVVLKDLPPYTVAGGVPAKVIRRRDA